jgi:putative serine protease PepD
MSDTQGVRPDHDGEQPQGTAAPNPQPQTHPQTEVPAAAAPVPPRPPMPAYPAGYHPGAGAPSHGASFGPAASPYGAHATQPTLPLGGTSAGGPTLGPSTATAERPAKKKSGAGKVTGLIVAAALVGGAAGLGTAYAGTQLWGQPTTTVVSGGGTVTVNNPESVTATTAIAAKVLPSVVTIEVSAGGSGGSGSGVVLSEDGYVVTNTHVVTLDGGTGTPEIRVTSSDGRIYDAEIVGTDPTYDLAVIRLVDAEGLTPIEFADSSELNVGDQSVAIGAPLGLANTVTTGIISALNRSIEIASSAAPESGGDDEGDGEEDQEQDQGPFQFDIPGQEQQSMASETIKIAVIQTDAAINPGNSGGALVDGEGRLIGINVAIATAGSSSESGSIGVGFSIPSNVVERITDEIIADGEATHGLLGATVLAASAVEGATISGAYIDSVTPGGAAEDGGLAADDIVTAFNGVPITDSVDLTAQVRAAAAGSEATVTYVRDGETREATVTLGALQ